MASLPSSLTGLTTSAAFRSALPLSRFRELPPLRWRAMMPRVRRCSSNEASLISFRTATELQQGQRALTVYASKSDSKGKPESEGSTDGPPLLTILAGVAVFLLLLWVVGSIITWLVGLIVNVPSYKK